MYFCLLTVCRACEADPISALRRGCSQSLGLPPLPRLAGMTCAYVYVVAVVLDYCAEEERRERKSKEKGVNKNHGETPHTCEALCKAKLPKVDNRYYGEKGEILSIRKRRKDKWHRARRLGGKLSMLHFFQFEEQSSLSFIAPLFSRGKIVLLKSIDRSEAVDTNGDSLIRQKPICPICPRHVDPVLLFHSSLGI